MPTVRRVWQAGSAAKASQEERSIIDWESEIDRELRELGLDSAAQQAPVGLQWGEENASVGGALGARERGPGTWLGPKKTGGGDKAPPASSGGRGKAGSSSTVKSPPDADVAGAARGTRARQSPEQQADQFATLAEQAAVEAGQAIIDKDVEKLLLITIQIRGYYKDANTAAPDSRGTEKADRIEKKSFNDFFDFMDELAETYCTDAIDLADSGDLEDAITQKESIESILDSAKRISSKESNLAKIKKSLKNAADHIQKKQDELAALPPPPPPPPAVGTAADLLQQLKSDAKAATDDLANNGDFDKFFTGWDKFQDTYKLMTDTFSGSDEALEAKRESDFLFKSFTTQARMKAEEALAAAQSALAAGNAEEARTRAQFARKLAVFAEKINPELTITDVVDILDFAKNAEDAIDGAVPISTISADEKAAKIAELVQEAESAKTKYDTGFNEKDAEKCFEAMKKMKAACAELGKIDKDSSKTTELEGIFESVKGMFLRNLGHTIRNNYDQSLLEAYTDDGNKGKICANLIVNFNAMITQIDNTFDRKAELDKYEEFVTQNVLSGLHSIGASTLSFIKKIEAESARDTCADKKGTIDTILSSFSASDEGERKTKIGKMHAALKETKISAKTARECSNVAKKASDKAAETQFDSDVDADDCRQRAAKDSAAAEQFAAEAEKIAADAEDAVTAAIPDSDDDVAGDNAVIQQIKDMIQKSDEELESLLLDDAALVKLEADGKYIQSLLDSFASKNTADMTELIQKAKASVTKTWDGYDSMRDAINRLKKTEKDIYVNWNIDYSVRMDLIANMLAEEAHDGDDYTNFQWFIDTLERYFVFYEDAHTLQKLVDELAKIQGDVTNKLKSKRTEKFTNKTASYTDTTLSDVVTKHSGIDASIAQEQGKLKTQTKKDELAVIVTDSETRFKNKKTRLDKSLALRITFQSQAEAIDTNKTIIEQLLDETSEVGSTVKEFVDTMKLKLITRKDIEQKRKDMESKQTTMIKLERDDLAYITHELMCKVKVAIVEFDLYASEEDNDRKNYDNAYAEFISSLEKIDIGDPKTICSSELLDLYIFLQTINTVDSTTEDWGTYVSSTEGKLFLEELKTNVGKIYEINKQGFADLESEYTILIKRFKEILSKYYIKVTPVTEDFYDTLFLDIDMPLKKFNLASFKSDLGSFMEYKLDNNVFREMKKACNIFLEIKKDKVTLTTEATKKVNEKLEKALNASIKHVKAGIKKNAVVIRDCIQEEAKIMGSLKENSDGLEEIKRKTFDAGSSSSSTPSTFPFSVTGLITTIQNLTGMTSPSASLETKFAELFEILEQNKKLLVANTEKARMAHLTIVEYSGWITALQAQSLEFRSGGSDNVNQSFVDLHNKYTSSGWGASHVVTLSEVLEVYNAHPSFGNTLFPENLFLIISARLNAPYDPSNLTSFDPSNLTSFDPTATGAGPAPPSEEEARKKSELQALIAEAKLAESQAKIYLDAEKATEARNEADKAEAAAVKAETDYADMDGVAEVRQHAEEAKKIASEAETKAKDKADAAAAAAQAESESATKASDAEAAALKAAGEAAKTAADRAKQNAEKLRKDADQAIAEAATSATTSATEEERKANEAAEKKAKEDKKKEDEALNAITEQAAAALTSAVGALSTAAPVAVDTQAAIDAQTELTAASNAAAAAEQAAHAAAAANALQLKKQQEADEEKRARDEASAAAVAAAAAATATADAAKITQLELQITHLKNQISSEQSSKTATTARFEQEKADEHLKSETDITKLKAEAAQLKLDIATANQQLQQEKNDRSSDVSTRDAQIANFGIEITGATSKFTLINSNLSTARSELATLTQTHNKLKAEHAASEAAKTALETVKTNNEAEILRLSGLLGKETGDLAKLKAEHTNLEAAKTAVDGKLAAAEAEVAALTAKETSLTAERTALALTKASLEGKITALNTEKATLNGQITSLNSAASAAAAQKANDIAVAKTKAVEEYKASVSAGSGSAATATAGASTAAAAAPGFVADSKFLALTNELDTFKKSLYITDSLGNTVITYDTTKNKALSAIIAKLLSEGPAILPTELNLRYTYMMIALNAVVIGFTRLSSSPGHSGAATIASQANYIKELQTWGQAMQKIAVDQYGASRKVTEFYGGFYEIAPPAAKQKLNGMPAQP